MVQVTLVAPAVQVQNLGAGGQQAQNATQTGVPAATPLSPGALVQGVITGKDQAGSYLLKTDQGTFTLHSDTPLTYNSDVLIRVDSSDAGTAGARIVSVNGEAFADYSAPLEQETDSLSPSLLAKTTTQATQNTSDVQDAQNPVLKSYTIPAVTVPTPASNGQTAIPLPPGTPVTLTTAEPTTAEAVTPETVATQVAATPSPNAAPPATSTAAAQIPQSSATPQQSTSNQQLPVSAATASTSTTTPTPAAEQNTTPPSTNTTTPQTAQQTTVNAQTAAPAAAVDEVPSNVAKLVVAQPQALADPSDPSSFFTATTAPAPQPQQPAVVQSPLYAAYAKTATPVPVPIAADSATPQPQLEGSVVTSNADGTLTLQTTQGALTVQPDALPPEVQLPAGTPLTVTLPANFAYITGDSVDTADDDSLPSTLKQAIGSLQAKNPAAAGELLSRLPAMGSDFLSSSIMFLSALLQGNARKILGENAAAALQDSGNEDVITKLEAHAAQTANSFQQPTDNKAANWQSVTLPFVYQGQVQEARIYVKRDAPRKTSDQKKTTSDTRFVVEISFSDLGDLQLDGMVMPKENTTMFDLVVRSQTPFLPEERAEITDIYNNTAQITGFRGNISFNVSKDFPVRPQAEILASIHRDIIA